jgi:hypothetical protein
MTTSMGRLLLATILSGRDDIRLVGLDPTMMRFAQVIFAAI